MVALAARATIATHQCVEVWSCLPPGAETRDTVRPIVVGSSLRARSPSETMPTSRLSLIDDRQAPDLGLGHVARHVVDAVGVEAVEHFLAHDIGDLGVQPACPERPRG